MNRPFRFSESEVIKREKVMEREWVLKRIKMTMQGKLASGGGGLELFSAILMSLATVGSAWSLYQATLWGGKQTFLLADSYKEARMASVRTVEANQQRLLDATMFMQYIDHVYRGENAPAEFYLKRFRPEFKVAVESWLATNPLQNPEAPPHPFAMPQYVVRKAAEAEEFEKEASARRTEAEEANRRSDRYVMTTVLFATVLFLSGIATKLGSPRLVLAFLIFASVVFFGTVGVLCTFPVTFD